MGVLEGKVALVTGATSGIGAACAEAIAAEGASALLAGRDGVRGKEVLARLRDRGTAAELVLGDVADSAFCDRLVEQTVARFGRIDLLVNAAGAMYRGDATEHSDENWRRIMAINSDAVFFLSRAAVRDMRKRRYGVIVNIASTVGVVAWKGLAAYCASKGAVILLTKAMALDHAQEGIRINAVCPGSVETPMLVSGYERSGLSSEEVLRRNAEGAPVGRNARPEEIAHAVVFLADDRSSFITGTTLMVDGGFTAQ